MKKMFLCMIALLLVSSMFVACEPNPDGNGETTVTTTQTNPASNNPGGGSNEDGVEFPQLPIY